ncbi:MAG: hypothetical protein FH751_08835 [Firmicutes bacterium]|nr:hypothetical protein [Bacillota bacterium]
MKNIYRIAEIIKEKIEKKYPNDVAIFAYYGSYAMGLNEEKSDLDFFFIPKTERGKELSLQFIIEDIGFDLFPITWERIARIVSLDQPLAAVITKSKVLYSATDKDLNKYLGLKEKLSQLYSTNESELMIKKGFDYFNETYVNLFNMKNGTKELSNVKIESSKIISNVLITIALINQTYYKRGLGKAVYEALKFKKLPQDFKELMDKILHGKNPLQIIEDSEILIKNTRVLLNEQSKKLSDKEPYETFFVGYYEELKSSLNKVIRACKEGDYYTAFLKSAFIQDELCSFIAKAEEGIWYNDYNDYSEYKEFYDELIGIDLISSVNDLDRLKGLIVKLDKKLRQLLTKENVSIVEFKNINEFEKFYKEE